MFPIHSQLYSEVSGLVSNIGTFAELIITGFRAVLGRPEQPGADDIFPVHCKFVTASRIVPEHHVA